MTCIKRITASRFREEIIHLSSAIIKLSPINTLQFWKPWLINLNGRKATKMGGGGRGEAGIYDLQGEAKESGLFQFGEEALERP